MIFCPACNAENPDGTKICVKCGTELPKTAVFTPPGVRKTSVAVPEKQYGVKDIGRDLVDTIWLILILFLILVGFLGEVTHWTFKFTQTEEAKLVESPVQMIVKPIHHPRRHVLASRPAPPPIFSETQPTVVGNPEALYSKSKEQFDARNYHTSFEYLKRALEIDPTYAKAYFGLGFLYARFDMDDAAVRMYEMALRFDPNNAEAVNNLGMMFEKAGNMDDALALLQQAVTLDGQNADYQYDLGSFYLDKNQPDDALPVFQKAADLRPSDASIYNDLALTYERLGKKQEAEDAWQKVLQYADRSDLLQQAKTHITFLQAQS